MGVKRIVVGERDICDLVCCPFHIVSFLCGRYSEAGGILILIQLMYQHLSNQKLQIQFCWSLLTLSGSDEIAVEISQQKGDLLVIQSLLSHRLVILPLCSLWELNLISTVSIYNRDDASIQEYGLWTLYNLCLANHDIAVMLKSKGVLELCQIAIEIHPKQNKVMQQVHNLRTFFAELGKSINISNNVNSLPPVSTSTVTGARRKLINK